MSIPTHKADIYPIHVIASSMKHAGSQIPECRAGQDMNEIEQQKSKQHSNLLKKQINILKLTVYQYSNLKELSSKSNIKAHLEM